MADQSTDPLGEQMSFTGISYRSRNDSKRVVSPNLIMRVLSPNSQTWETGAHCTHSLWTGKQVGECPHLVVHLSCASPGQLSWSLVLTGGLARDSQQPLLFSPGRGLENLAGFGNFLNCFELFNFCVRNFSLGWNGMFEAWRKLLHNSSSVLSRPRSLSENNLILNISVS